MLIEGFRFNEETIRLDGEGAWGRMWDMAARVIRNTWGFDPNSEGLKQRTDAGESYFLERQLKYVFTERLKEDRAPAKAMLFLPVNTEVPSGAKTHVYQILRTVGEARVITDYADDLPPVDVVQSEVVGKLISIGHSFGWSIDDLRAAAFAGQPLQTDKMNAAADEVEHTIDRVSSIGDVANNIVGFLNNPNVPVITLPTGSWPTADPEQILDDLIHMEETIATAVFHRADLMPDTLILDDASWRLCRKRLNEYSDQSILEVFLKTSATVKNADVWHRCNTVNAGGPRIVMYRRDPSIVRLIIAQMFEMLPPQANNLYFKVPTHAKIGGVDVRKPYTMAYAHPN